MLVLTSAVHGQMVAACLDAWPLEACGLIAGPGPDQGAVGGARASDGDAVALACYPATNAAASSRVYTVEPRDMLRADREAEAAGLEVLGVWHSHTHTDAYPSPTDVAQAPDPGWHYVLVSLRDTQPMVRSYRVHGDQIEEEPVALQ